MPSLPANVPTRTVHLRTDSGDAAATVACCTRAGVDVGSVGRALALEPSSVRLNGFFLSRGGDFVSSVSWDTLLRFFAARGLPAGGSPDDAVAVQGKPRTPSDDDIRLCGKRKCVEGALISPKKKRMLIYSVDESEIPIKRKLEVDHANLVKKMRSLPSSSDHESGSELPIDDVLNLMKRRLSLDEETSVKKRKIYASTSCGQIFAYVVKYF